jgi:heme A synthase
MGCRNRFTRIDVVAASGGVIPLLIQPAIGTSNRGLTPPARRVISHMAPLSHSRPVPAWLHAWAVLTVVVATALLALGGVVTTIQAGMSDPDWPTYPWHLLISSWDMGRFDFVVEHSHRAAGYLVGCCVIVLAIGLWLQARARWLAWLGTAALLGVVAQGVLGGMRVLFDVSQGSTLKEIHGFFAQVVFSLLVGLAVLTARRSPGASLEEGHARRCFRSALALSVLLLIQLAWGVLVRHTHAGAAQRLHILTAFAVVAAAAWFIKTAWETPAGWQAFGRPAVLLVVLLVVQLALGVEAWIDQYAGPLPPEAQAVTLPSAIVRTAHVLVGTGILATAVVAAMQAYRVTLPVVVEQEPSEPTPALDTSYRPAASSLVGAASHQVKGTA